MQQTVHELLQTRGIDPERHGVAVAVNGEVVHRKAWKTHVIKPEDRVEIVTAVAGG
ncbi:MAG: sulfur carrier protein ThiS [Candidatus Caldarchaeum sp.]|nr:sulfur carrier protein ThiS [Candidatus Caldarchaeum sp.]MCS7094685.1 sulfur carrier protein ThiS [Candidatus Calditenuaceae archaeon]